MINIKKSTIIFLLLMLFASVFSKSKIKYTIENIPENLITRADAIIRENNVEIYLNSKKEFIIKSYFVVTIMNKSGEKYATNVEHYDKDSKVTTFEAVLYDKTGKKTKRAKSSEIIDVSTNSGYTLFDDNRAIYTTLKGSEFPYTVEFTSEKKVCGGFFIPNWALLSTTNLSIQKNTHRVYVADGIDFRFKNINGAEQYMTTGTQNEYKYYEWSAENVQSEKWEDYQPSTYELSPKALTSIGDFDFEGFKGNLSSWENFGKWSAKLNEDRQRISDETKEDLKIIIAENPNKRKQVEAIYEYMQKRTRYVNISVGIGGFQPFPAETVDRLGYGDCKALSNYTYSLLKACGIKSYYTLIYGGKKPLFYRDFPSQQFNHAILTVPMEKDTMWLECTSQNNPAGFIAGFTDDRDALIITDNGGKLIKTKKYTSNDNLQKSKATVIIKESGQAEIEAEIIWKGRQYADNRYIFNEDEKSQKKFIHSFFNEIDIEISNYTFNEVKSEDPSLKLKLKFTSKNIGTISDSRFIIAGSIFSKNNNTLKKNSNRKKPFEFIYNYTDIDSIEVILPNNFKMEYEPKQDKVYSQFGTYSYNFNKKENKLIYNRKLQRNKGIFEAKEYNQYVDFLRKLSGYDRQKISFLKTL